MAIEKPIEIEIDGKPTGTLATYWRIVRADFDVRENRVWYVMAGYLDKASRDAGKGPLKEMAFTLHIPEGVALEQVTREFMYNDAKAEREQFRDAKDDQPARAAAV